VLGAAAASASRPSSWARPWARGSSRPRRAPRSLRWRASTAPTRDGAISGGPLDKVAARALTDRFKAACGADGAQVIYDGVGGDYTEAALRAIAWQGRHLVVGFTAGIPKIAAESAAAQELPDHRRVLGRVHGAHPRCMRQCRGAHGAVSRGPHQARGHRAISAGARAERRSRGSAPASARGKIVVIIE
jgi:hypothetical protein